MTDIVIWGASGHAKVLYEFCGKLGYAVVALFDNDTAVAAPIPGVRLFHARDGFLEWKNERNREGVGCLVAIGGARGKDRLEIQQYLGSHGIQAVTVTHPAAYVSESASLGQGSQILAGAVVGAEARLGRACIVNTAASVDHECQLGDGVHIGPGVTLAGCVRVGEFSFIGAGAVVLPRMTIGIGCVIGAGAVVTRDVPDGVVAYGNPARVQK